MRIIEDRTLDMGVHTESSAMGKAVMGVNGEFLGIYEGKGRILVQGGYFFCKRFTRKERSKYDFEGTANEFGEEWLRRRNICAG